MTPLPDAYNIVTTIKKGCLHIGVYQNFDDAFCFGRKINSYNNCLSKTLARLFHKTRKIHVGDQEFWINKKSFKKHVYSIQNSHCRKTLNAGYHLFRSDMKYSESEKYKCYDYAFNNLAQRGSLVADSTIPFANIVSEKNRIKLAKEIAEELEKPRLNQARIMRLVQSGAELHLKFFAKWHPDKSRHSKIKISADIPDNHSFESFSHYTLLARTLERQIYLVPDELTGNQEPDRKLSTLIYNVIKRNYDNDLPQFMLHSQKIDSKGDERKETYKTVGLNVYQDAIYLVAAEKL